MLTYLIAEVDLAPIAYQCLRCLDVARLGSGMEGVRVPAPPGRRDHEGAYSLESAVSCPHGASLPGCATEVSV